MGILGQIKSHGYTCTIHEDPDGRVHYVAGAAICADGANGQHGAPPAYRADDSGSDLLANGGMKLVDGKVTCAHDWSRNVVVLGPDNQPRVFGGGMIASMTWYRIPGKQRDDPAAYVDAETVPYIVVPPMVVRKTYGVVRGAKARATWNGRSVDCVVAELGPHDRIGEMSIAAARELGIPANPRHGGLERAEVLYELWPDVAAQGFELIAAGD
jgi:hypothetical protein